MVQSLVKEGQASRSVTSTRSRTTQHLPPVDRPHHHRWNFPFFPLPFPFGGLPPSTGMSSGGLSSPPSFTAQGSAATSDLSYQRVRHRLPGCRGPRCKLRSAFNSCWAAFSSSLKYDAASLSNSSKAAAAEKQQQQSSCSRSRAAAAAQQQQSSNTNKKVAAAKSIISQIALVAKQQHSRQAEATAAAVEAAGAAKQQKPSIVAKQQQ